MVSSNIYYKIVSKYMKDNEVVMYGLITNINNTEVKYTREQVIYLVASGRVLNCSVVLDKDTVKLIGIENIPIVNNIDMETTIIPDINRYMRYNDTIRLDISGDRLLHKVYLNKYSSIDKAIVNIENNISSLIDDINKLNEIYRKSNIQYLIKVNSKSIDNIMALYIASAITDNMLTIYIGFDKNGIANMNILLYMNKEYKDTKRVIFSTVEIVDAINRMFKETNYRIRLDI